MQRSRVGVLFGGQSAEHEISILSARNIVAALDQDRFESVLIGISKEGQWLLASETMLLGAGGVLRFARLHNHVPMMIQPHAAHQIFLVEQEKYQERLVSAIDVIFPVLHGPMGEDGTVQGLLEMIGIPYVGSGVLGSAIGMDKDVMKRLLSQAGIPTTSFRTLHAHDFKRDPVSVSYKAIEVGFPLFIKPANSGSSIGIRRVKSQQELQEALEHAFLYDHKVLAEAAISGREIECSVLGGNVPVASLPGELIIKHPDGFYSYHAKYVDETGALLQIPAQLEADQIHRIQTTAIEAFRVLECDGMARVDFFLQADGSLLLNEINTIPGFTNISMYPKLWEATGLPQQQLITRLIDLALERHQKRKALRTSIINKQQLLGSGR
ncbi:D-alanine--D-alanine ligase family protein [Pajaroellobacter abortibovis]|uniref:D-alanine--D-alanine ligase n=1 Tax=Pajaroellobacter abortibovis TaxID=1882918 RepID=A0A1L6MXN1_9BACT|nr:D-alanine--D-alanine ligase family protein [Pajaroellobacter abortibovis]APS00343.1 D-alanine--D-alanine ligase A [Pajaroellobacter abortibovis]